MTSAGRRYFLTLLVLSVLMAVYGFYLGTLDEDVGDSLATAWLLVFSVLVALWVGGESRASVPAFDWPAYVFVAWPFVLPFYFWRTRGPEGLATYAGLYGLCFGYSWLNIYGWRYFVE